MTGTLHVIGLSIVTVVLVLASAPGAAQVDVTSADIQRLQQQVFDAGSEITQLRGRDSALAARLQAELDDLREEVTYLKVKLRKERRVVRDEYADVRDRLENLRTRARGGTTAPAATGSQGGYTRAASGPPNTVPVGTEIDVRLQSPLNSSTAKVEDRFEATTLVDLAEGDGVLIPAGSVVRGIVTSVESATRLNRKGRLSVSFDQVTVRGRVYPIRATVTQALESEGIRGEAGKIGTGAGVGAVIGGILGGVRGALAGILIGGGAVVAATEGQEADLPAGTILRVRFDTPLTVR